LLIEYCGLPSLYDEDFGRVFCEF